MKLIKPSFTIIEQDPGLEGIYRQIELAGRTCYKSEDKITPTSAKEFVSRMVKSGHGAMLEHGTVYLAIPESDERGLPLFPDSLANNPHTKSALAYSIWHVTTNYRVLVENNLLEYLKYICEPTEYHEKRYTVKFTCDRGVTHEFVRHRVFSFAQESTRYCNYSKDKFGSEVTFILPPWLDENDPNLHRRANYAVDEYGECLTEYYYRISEKGANEGMYVNTHQTFAVALQTAENLYFSLLENGWKAQEARAVLPNAVKAELVMTGFISDWQHFFELRCASTAHPQARELALPLKAAFINKTYL